MASQTANGRRGQAKLLVCGENEDITICDIIKNNLF